MSHVCNITLWPTIKLFACIETTPSHTKSPRHPLHIPPLSNIHTNHGPSMKTNKTEIVAQSKTQIKDLLSSIQRFDILRDRAERECWNRALLMYDASRIFLKSRHLGKSASVMSQELSPWSRSPLPDRTQPLCSQMRIAWKKPVQQSSHWRCTVSIETVPRYRNADEWQEAFFLTSDDLPHRNCVEISDDVVSAKEQLDLINAFKL